MARLALQRCVLALERERRQPFMIEFRPIKACQRKFLPVMFRVATSAIDLCRGRGIGFGVIARVGLHAMLDFDVALQTL